MWLGTKKQLAKITVRDVPLLSTACGHTHSRRLSTRHHWQSTACGRAYLPLSAVAAIINCDNTSNQSLPTKAAETLVHAFVSSRPDYCNALLYGVADGLYRRLQSVQNAAVRLESWPRRRGHIRPTLQRLHWLPLRQLVLFRIAVLVYQCLNGLAPSYLADDCQLVSDVRPRQLRSSDSVTCAVRRTRTTYGDRCFAVAGPQVWNSLPAELRQSDSLGQFKRRLKTHLFGLWDHST